MDIKELIDSGARCIDKEKGLARMIDVICLALTALILSFSGITYWIVGQRAILVPGLIEAVMFLAIRELNKKGRPIFAAFALILVNGGSAFYFSALMGITTEAHLLIFFFVGTIFLFFRKRKHRLIAFGFTLVTLLLCEINLYFELLPPLVQTHKNQFIIRWLALPWVISLDIFVLYLYIRSKDLKLKDLKKLSYTAHELKTPLNAIMLILDELKEKGQSEISREQLNDLIAAATQCRLNLENELISSKIGADQVPQIVHESVHIRSVIDGALDLNLYMAKAFGVKLLWHWHGMPEWVLTDGNKITKILNNLVTNALKFTPEGKTVTVDMSCDGDYWQIAVTDQGHGIRTENLDKIFKPYFTEGGTISGTGLGLPITNELVKSLGGTIAVKTSSNGSCFTATMPLIEANDLNSGEPDISLLVNRMQAEESKPWDDHSVLLIEDDIATQKYFGKLLLRMGAAVTVLSDVKMAIDQATRLTPEIILLDLNTCPELTGVDSVHVLAMHYPNARIVAVSGDKKALDEATFSCFATLEKPLVRSQLLRVARSFVMENSRAAIT